MKKIILVSQTFLTGCLILSSCNREQANSEQSADSTVIATDTTPVSESASFKFSYAIANLPSPFEVLEEFSKSNLPVDVSLLNPVENLNNYHTTAKEAFNYGIYGVDLGYLVVNNRTMDALRYYSTCKKLAEQLSMAETFNHFVSRFENNSSNPDSLKRIVDEAYSATDAYLRSNARLEAASEILAGSWLECQHITVELLKNTDRTPDNEKLVQRIWEQRLHLDNITKVLDEFKNDNDVSKIKADFEALLSIYKEPHDSNEINKDFLNKLSGKLNEVRNKIIG